VEPRRGWPWIRRSFNFENNSDGFKDPRYAKLVNSAATEPDAAKRKQIYGQLNDYLLDQSLTMPLSLYPSTALTTAKSARPGVRHDSALHAARHLGWTSRLVSAHL
jgi:ABC-type transport system substrate-binding protein